MFFYHKPSHQHSTVDMTFPWFGYNYKLSVYKTANPMAVFGKTCLNLVLFNFELYIWPIIIFLLIERHWWVFLSKNGAFDFQKFAILVSIMTAPISPILIVYFTKYVYYVLVKITLILLNQNKIIFYIPKRCFQISSCVRL